MNSYPTPETPWYVVYYEGIKGTTYYQSSYSEHNDTFHKSKLGAQIFLNLKAAVIVAQATESSIRVLFNADEAKEFGRD